MYGVGTKEVNQAVKNNLDKFPNGYIIELNIKKLQYLRSKFLISNPTTKLTKTRTLSKAFTEKGLYMLATILKSEEETQTTLAIIKTFAKVMGLTRIFMKWRKKRRE